MKGVMTVYEKDCMQNAFSLSSEACRVAQRYQCSEIKEVNR